MAKAEMRSNPVVLEPFVGSQGLRLVGLAREDREDLVATIHERLIPHLVLAHLEESLGEVVCPDVRGPPTAKEIDALARLAVAQELPAMLEFVEWMANEGLSLEVILLQLVAPAARWLGDQWIEDDRTFTEVAIGLSTIQQLVHVLGPSFAPLSPHRGFVVLTTTAAEHHTLGVYLLGEFLRRAGWGVQVSPNMTEQDAVSLVETQHVEVLGISVSNSEFFEPLTAMIKSVRKATLNPHMSILLGGAAELEARARELGATYCFGPLEAVQWLESGDCALRMP